MQGRAGGCRLELGGCRVELGVCSMYRCGGTVWPYFEAPPALCI